MATRTTRRLFPGLSGVLRGAGVIAIALMALLSVTLVGSFLFKAISSLSGVGFFNVIFGTDWRPTHGEFGLWAFAVGTVTVSLLSIVIAIPIGTLAAVGLVEYLPERLRHLMRTIVDLLAGIPSVVYGLWGVTVIVPFLRVRVMAPLGIVGTGYSALAAGLVLALMVLPVQIQLSCQAIMAVPRGLREAALSLGAPVGTMVRTVVLRKAVPGITAASTLAFTRAAGETMAVVMVVGNVARIPRGLFDPVYPLSALIVNTYGELLSIPRYEGAIMAAALLLIVVEALFVLASGGLMKKVQEALCVR
ncbi:MAG: phosphate ABC transporter permease subunit PstC [Spirochaetaceae bacterium]|nr:phosphate ABC transporter permease subunit PstC [Spirochaetaceae bacterium]